MKKYIEKNKTVKIIETVVAILLFIGAIFFLVSGFMNAYKDPGNFTFKEEVTMVQSEDNECDSDEQSVCEITYIDAEDNEYVKKIDAEEYEDLAEEITLYVYETSNYDYIYAESKNVSQSELYDAYHTQMLNENMVTINIGSALLLLAISVVVMCVFGGFFTTYEKSWFLSIMVLATIFAILFPEESANGVNGCIIMGLYLLDTFLNILCELLISKQSRWNFIVSIGVELTEILICVVLMYRFATMATTLFFWLPIDIASFVMWSKNKDKDDDELTVVKRLTGWQEVLVLIGIGVWTIVLGYFISGLNIQTDFINNHSLETAIIYIDACASAVGVANGLFIFFRLREQWIAWYICAILEAVINIMSGQYVLLILKLGYITNTTYGYIKWTKYIKSHAKIKEIGNN